RKILNLQTRVRFPVALPTLFSYLVRSAALACTQTVSPLWAGSTPHSIGPAPEHFTALLCNLKLPQSRNGYTIVHAIEVRGLSSSRCVRLNTRLLQFISIAAQLP